jgi:hypothetical protein
MKAYKNLFSYLCLFFFLILLGIFSFYLFNPFSNECIQGNCENGNGVYVFHSGMKYDGEWNNGKRDGQGTLTYPDGSKYTGGWKNNRMHGQGIKIYTSDRSYEKYIGEWKNGNKHGKGTAIYSSGSRYDGDWKDGEMHGHGTITTLDGRKIIGEWKNEILHGTTTEIYPDGKILVVGRRDSRRHGRGTLTYPDGTKITSEWINNKLVGSLEFYLFTGFEFEAGYSITALCKAIQRDIGLTLKAQEFTIKWLNELLKVPNLYEEFNKKIQSAGFSQEIDTLIERTKDLRNKRFSELNIDNQKDIVKLNRLLIEHFYRAPKSSII